MLSVLPGAAMIWRFGRMINLTLNEKTRSPSQPKFRQRGNRPTGWMLADTWLVRLLIPESKRIVVLFHLF